MKLSTKVRYGLRFLLDLGMHDQEGNIKLKDVAQRQFISEKYLWQVVHPLKTAGLVHAVAGPGGGYQLARSPSAITVYDILSVLDGEGGLIDCASGSDACARSAACAARVAWTALEKAITGTARSITLGALIEQQRLLDAGQTATYVI